MERGVFGVRFCWRLERLYEGPTRAVRRFCTGAFCPDSLAKGPPFLSFGGFFRFRGVAVSGFKRFGGNGSGSAFRILAFRD